MRLASGEALLLEVADLQDGDRIVGFLTRREGRKRGAARGARRRYSRFAGQLQPLAKVHVAWLERDDRELVRVREVEMLRPAHRLYGDLEGILLGCYLAEQVQVFAPENDGDEVLFRLLDSTVDALLAGADRGVAARYFECWLLRLAGLLPSARECSACGGDLGGGAVWPRGGEGLLCRRCGGGPASLAVDPEVLAFLLLVARTALPALAADGVPTAVLGRVERLCGEIRRGFLHGELKSYEVMQRTLAGVAPGGEGGG
ncbi:MAG TPA: DNA repair protein RecO [Thermoanaerobaculia bacterium]|nr:DNA repair protein RecO [Thermoanaerobaculia bacterium]